MKILASYNIKGGVGKTATTVNLAYLCAQQGWRTLIWDLDPQGATSYYFRIKPKVKGGSKNLISKKKIENKIKASDYDNLDILPADFSYRNMDIILTQQKKCDQQFSVLFSSLEDEYDYIFMDCPPSISLVSENVLQAAEYLFIPTIPTVLSLRTYEQLQKFIQQHHLTHLKLLPFFSMVDKRKHIHLDVIRNAQNTFNTLSTQIPYAVDVERMGIERAPIHIFAGQSSAAKSYVRLWDEIVQIIN